MTAEQTTAFNAGVNSVVTPAGLLLGIASLIAVILLLWLAWMALSQFQSWQLRQQSFFGMKSNIVRATIIVLLLGFFIR